MYQIWISKVWKSAKLLENLYFVSFKIKTIQNENFNKVHNNKNPKLK